MAGIRFEHVTKRFGAHAVVSDLNLEVADGEFLVLVGPSGCGKSTTLRMLGGLDSVSDGAIYLDGRRVDTVPAKDRNLAMVFQSYALYPHMTVFENMAFGLRLRRQPGDEVQRRVEETARTLGIDDLLQRKPAALSGGQRQRVALGRAIVRQPAAFLLDEPLSNLDAKLRVQTRAEISLLHERLGATFVYVTHDQVEAMTMATRIAVMDAGEVQQVGPPQELYERPANRFVAAFIGSPEMNFLDARVERAAESIELVAGTLRLPAPPELAAALAPYAGSSVVVGVRPEHLYDPAHMPARVQPQLIEADVTVVERLGNETFLHLRRDGQRLLARVDPASAARAGAPASIAIDVTKLHVFDPATGRAVVRGPHDGHHA
ncbi:MAG: ABC transporter ATP-binding protein [Dehalococcoidia bacterium]